MNSTAGADVAAFINEENFFAIQDYYATAIAMIMMWHYLLTLDQEVAYFWRHRPTGACALFLANRYLTLIVSIYNTPWWSVSTTYTPSVSFLPKMYSALINVLLVNAASRVSLFVADFIVVVVTRSVTHVHRRETFLCTRMSIASVLYKYGGIHFLLLTIYNTLRLVITLLSITRGTAATMFVSTFANFSDPLIGILMTHFLVALQEATSSAPAEGYDSGSALSVGTLRFVRADVDNWLQQSVISSVRFTVNGQPHALESWPVDPSESVGLLHFVRADVDSYSQSENDPEEHEATLGSVAHTVTDYTFQYSQYVIWAVFSFLRVYALQMRRGWAVFVLVLSLGHVAYGTWVTVTEDIIFNSKDGCHSQSTMPEMLNVRLMLIMHALYLMDRTLPAGPEPTLMLLYFLHFFPLLIEPTIGILVSHFLISLQEAVNRRVHHLDDTHSSVVASDSQDSAGTGSVSLVQFARADVDEWLDSEAPGAPPGPVDDGPRAQWEEECIEALKTVQERVSSSDCHESV
ncbi:uncharacterized protein TRAVEDRAFT_53535 [Trametes versicolor FP-101664 SS1]|uniref:uncharacterized protein n=1 Tax=Trametes versicolor (strain FP-101664) TaxID=717944 RepID=UPI0004622A99|nr:uncharacterized protein TRAVEDRAFT_53535 [Trametes versicolor FP-101664 SS1]EIW53124.1 hypothetical protein TRAVEDRAFT_53535 [Trametes versicolor FP-101664 SS1]